MTQTFDNALTQVTTVLKTVSGIEKVAINPPETANNDLMIITYAELGVVHNSPVGQRDGDIAILLLRRRIDLATDFSVLRPFIDTIPTALKAEVDPGGNRFNNSIQVFTNTQWKYETLDYAGVQWACYHYTMRDCIITV
jgi:hypothetical protein